MKRSEYLTQCGILPKWHKKKLSDFSNDEEALSKVREYFKNFDAYFERGIGLFLYGANGVGKTHLMTTAFIRVADVHQKTIRIVTPARMINIYTKVWGGDEEEYNGLLNCDFLGIEDLGKEFRSSGNEEGSKLHVNTIDNIIRHRVQANKVTWVTTNMKPSEMKARYSQDVSSMLKECCVALVVKGSDFRGNMIPKELKFKDK